MTDEVERPSAKRDRAARFYRIVRFLEERGEAGARPPPGEEIRRRVQVLTQAWAERRIVRLTYDTGTYAPGRGPREARVRPYLIEPSSTTHALYLIGHDETRGAIRTFKIERILD